MLKQLYPLPVKRFLKFVLFIFFPLATYANTEAYKPLLLLSTINQQISSETILFLQTSNHQQILASQSFFKNNKILLPAKPDLVYRAENYYSLNKIPGLTYKINEQNVSIAIFVPVQYLVKQHYEINSSQKLDIYPKSPGAYLNYNLSQQAISGVYSQTGGIFEAVAFNRYGIGSSSFLLLKKNDLINPTHNDQQVLRLTTTWTYDNPSNMHSLRLGDIYTHSGAWGQSVMLGGIQLATNFATQPNFITYPMPAVRGAAVVPSSVDLYVNNVLMNSRKIEPGPFDLSNIPVVNGYGNIEVVTTNLLGQKQITTVSYYNSSVLLKPGLQNYSYEAGYIRNDLGIASNAYKHFAAVGTHAIGVNDHLTLQAHMELLRDKQNAGLAANYLLGNWGVVNLGAAVSHSLNQGIGELLQLGFQHQGFNQIGYGFNMQLTSAAFNQLGFQADKKPPKLQWQSFLGFPLHDGSSIGLSYTKLVNRDTEPNLSLLNISYSRSINSFTSFSLSGITNIGGYPTKAAFANLILSLGTNTSLSAGATAQEKNNQGYLQLMRGVPAGTGYGYNLKVDHSQAQTNYLASVSAQNNIGLYTAKVSNYNHQTGYELNGIGSLVLFDKSIYLTRQIMNSFGLIKTGIPNITVYSFNQPIGKTNRHGDLIVPNLVAYQKNKVNIDPNSVPLDVTIDTIQLTSIPYYRSGDLLKFPLHYAHAAAMELVSAADHKPIPAGAIAYFKNANFVVGNEGRLYITDLAENKSNQFVVKWDDSSCTAKVNYQTQPNTPIANLGRIICE